MNHILFTLLDRLDAAKMHYTLARHRADSVLVAVTVVGQRIEIDVFRDGHVEVARFVGHEDVEGGEELIDSIVELGR